MHTLISQHLRTLIFQCQLHSGYSTAIYLQFKPISFSLSNSVHLLSVQDGRKKGKRRDEAGKHTTKKQGQESASLTDTRAESICPQTPDDLNVEPELMVVYTRLLHRKASLFIYLSMRFVFGFFFQFFRTPISSTIQPVKTLVNLNGTQWRTFVRNSETETFSELLFLYILLINNF